MYWNLLNCCYCYSSQTCYLNFMQEFIVNEGGGEAPMEGSIPDMTSSTEWVIRFSLEYYQWNLINLFIDWRLDSNFCRHYVNLQNIYQAKAEADFMVIDQRARNILKKIGRDPNSISKTTTKSFCKNARKLKVCTELLYYYYYFVQSAGISSWYDMDFLIIKLPFSLIKKIL